MIAPILAITLASVVGCSQVETVDLAAMPVSDLVSSLSKSWGEELSVHPNIGREVVKLRCHNETREEILRVLSKILSAEWVASRSGERVLVRTDAMRRRLARDELSQRKSTIENALRDQAWPGKTIEPREQAELLVRSYRSWYQQRNLTLVHNYQSTPRQTNARLLLQRLVAAVGSDLLAGLAIGQSVVFGAPQTGKQKPFGKEQGRAISDYEEIEHYFGELVPPEWLTDLSARYWTENVFGPALRGAKSDRSWFMRWQRKIQSALLLPYTMSPDVFARAIIST